LIPEGKVDNIYCLQIYCNTGVKPQDLFKGNGVANKGVIVYINGQKFEVYFFNNNFYLEVGGSPDSKVICLGEDTISVFYDPGIFLKYVNLLIETHLSRYKMTWNGCCE
jgi:hypothetical protein